jgi:hypothetical protein
MSFSLVAKRPRGAAIMSGANLDPTLDEVIPWGTQTVRDGRL